MDYEEAMIYLILSAILLGVAYGLLATRSLIDAIYYTMVALIPALTIGLFLTIVEYIKVTRGNFNVL